MGWWGGQIMKTTTTKNIFWGKSWASYKGDKITGMDQFCTAYSGSNYAMTVDEYTGTNGAVGPVTTHLGHVVDTSAAASGNNYQAILNEVCKMIPNPVANGFYSVFTDRKRGHAQYCAWHDSGYCGNVLVQIAFFWDLDGDSGCDPQSTVSGQSQGLAALANVYAHEISEARSDPHGDGWYDYYGNENGDKCAWTFNVPYVSLSDGSKWKLQGEWSNAAYLAGTGYPNDIGLGGCLDGH